ncbi:hypothetical protein [uncultured Pseudomonas sp.]|uniref:hypothetical protein n=1 Tax=uncultured Pseudomonas sp. TaxID=114707 RepID=UPI00258526D8|nr:hypothetical protein [uncultured Pseudomonas sp.]
MKILKSTVSMFFILLSMSAFSGEKTEDIRAQVEVQLLRCVGDGFPRNCWIKTFSGKIVPWLAGREQQVLSAGEEHWLDWLSGGSVFGVYKLDAIQKAQIFDSRSYIVERADGEVAGLIVGFRRVAGKWYVSDIQSDNTKAFLDRILDMHQLDSIPKSR